MIPGVALHFNRELAVYVIQHLLRFKGSSVLSVQENIDDLDKLKR